MRMARVAPEKTVFRPVLPMRAYLSESYGMTMRKAIAKKTRFEVFKRDSFKCQYCGHGAPDVLLEVDHIKPVAKGGKNDILNLITACNPCNNGKSDRELSDGAVLSKQLDQMAVLNERRVQLEMLAEWRDGLFDLTAQGAALVAKELETRSGQWKLSDIGRTELQQLVKKYGVQCVLDALDKCFDRHVRKPTADITREDMGVVSSKLPLFCAMEARPDWERKLYYNRGILRKRLSYVDDAEALRLMRDAYQGGASLTWIEDCAKTARNYSHFADLMIQGQ